MAKKMLIDATHPEETRVVVADGTRVEDFDFETVNKRQLAGNIYLAKVTRVEPSLQAAFVEYGGNRHGFLAFAEIHPDYYQIPAADRRALIEEDRAAAQADEDEEHARERRGSKGRRGRARSDERTGERAERAAGGDAVTRSDAIQGMEIADSAEAEDEAAVEPGFAADAGDKVDPSVAGQGGDEAAPERAAEPPADEDTPAEEAQGEDNPADEIESVAEEDVAEEIRPARKPRARRYKIQEVIRVRQIMLVQVVKEERGNKGAALTTYLSLPGRYCVLMPNTARGGGISRKITNVADRKKLKEIAAELEVPQGAGLIIRTAGSQRTRTEIKRDYEYLMRLWDQIRERTFRSIAPAAIYEEGDLIKRSIRDLYGNDIDEVWVDGERGYRTARDFMAMIMPDQVRAVRHYTDPMPLFARHQVESYLAGMFNPTVQLKSGGYIVIGITEALVAIDVNSGRATKEGSIEETAFKTNCEAADEIARQLRLRDLAGLIVIDFIDMDERRNNAAVEKRFKDALKHDRARIQVGRISGFGLMEMSRQRLRPGMLESTTQPCAHCHGTGLIRSDDSMALTILRAIEDEGTRKRSREVLVRAPVAVANFLMNHKREHLGMIETRYGLSVRLEADPALISPDFTMEKFKTASRSVPEAVSGALSVDASLMAQIDEAEDTLLVETAEPEAEMPNAAAVRPASEAADDSDEGHARRRRRRRRGGRGDDEGGPADEAGGSEAAENAAPAEAAAPEGDEAESGGRSRRRGRARRRKDRDAGASSEAAAPMGAILDESRDAAAGVPEDIETGGIPANADGLGAWPKHDALQGEPADAEGMPAADGTVEMAAQSDGQDGAAGSVADQDELDPGRPDEADAEPALSRNEPAAPVALPHEAAPTAEADPIPDAAASPQADGAGDQSAPADIAQSPAGADAPAPRASDPSRPRRRGWWSQG